MSGKRFFRASLAVIDIGPPTIWSTSTIYRTIPGRTCIGYNGRNETPLLLPLLLEFVDAEYVRVTLWTFRGTDQYWLDTMDLEYVLRASHNPSVVGSIPIGPTNQDMAIQVYAPDNTTRSAMQFATRGCAVCS